MHRLDSRKENGAFYCSSIIPPINQALIPWLGTSGFEVRKFSNVDAKTLANHG